MIYPIDQTIEKLLNSAVDEETGEIILTEEELAAKIAAAEMDFFDKIDALCSVAKNKKAEALGIKEEKLKLGKRQKSDEKTVDWAKDTIGFLLQGEKFKNARHSVYYLSSQELVIDDEEALVEWCKMNAPGFLNEPTLRSDDIKAAIKNGKLVPFAHIQNNKSVVVR